ncbi:hypothetical protein ABZ805_12310 [Saccharopolyspora sp. NPDC047091]|uniref:hypothetical protein n=1 Tax=Saccharopolyspora sp. NPDC047091 TaxID=3155924 RepID=UPI0033DB10F2
MDSTPIYTELQQQLIDPEASNWGLSAPPEFAAALTESAESSAAEPAATQHADAGGRGKGRRHRAAD